MNQNEIKVLLVDDETAFADTLAQRLKMRHLKVATTYDGEQTLSKLSEMNPDVIVLDLQMPGMYGTEVLREIKKAKPDIQVIILSGHGTDQDEEEARKFGSFDFLKKPVEIDLLEQIIRKAFREMLDKKVSAAENESDP